MSVAAMAHVWAVSGARGTELLVALAIADFADDDGIAWPSVATLAGKARCAERTAQDALAALQRRGELAVEVGAGPRGTNIYRLFLGGGAKFAPPQNAAGRGAKCSRERVRPAAPKPPEVNHQRTTTSRAREGGGAVGEEDDLVAAAAWAAAAAGNPPRRPAAFAAAVRRRLRKEGASAEDLATLDRWRAAQAARERERESGGGGELRRSARPDQLAALARAIGR